MKAYGEGPAWWTSPLTGNRFRVYVKREHKTMLWVEALELIHGGEKPPYGVAVGCAFNAPKRLVSRPHGQVRMWKE